MSVLDLVRPHTEKSKLKQAAHTQEIAEQFPATQVLRVRSSSIILKYIVSLPGWSGHTHAFRCEIVPPPFRFPEGSARPTMDSEQPAGDRDNASSVPLILAGGRENAPPA